jgi:hypothetical protein
VALPNNPKRLKTIITNRRITKNVPLISPRTVQLKQRLKRNLNNITIRTHQNRNLEKMRTFQMLQTSTSLKTRAKENNRNYRKRLIHL